MDCLKTQSTAGLFGQLLQMMIQSRSHHDGTGSGRAGGKNRSTTTISRSSFLPACDCVFFSVCPFVCVYFSLSPPLAEDEWVMLYRRPGDGIHAAIGDRHTTNRRSAVFEVPHYSQVTSPQFSNTVGQTGRKWGKRKDFFCCRLLYNSENVCLNSTVL